MVLDVFEPVQEKRKRNQVLYCLGHAETFPGYFQLSSALRAFEVPFGRKQVHLLLDFHAE